MNRRIVSYLRRKVTQIEYFGEESARKRGQRPSIPTREQGRETRIFALLLAAPTRSSRSIFAELGGHRADVFATVKRLRSLLEIPPSGV
jgi:hypothetical protein